MIDWDVTGKLVTLLVPLIGTIVGGWALMKRQGESNEKATERLSARFEQVSEASRENIEALSRRFDGKFEKITSTLSSMQVVSEEAIRQARAAHARLDSGEREASAEREARARLEEQFRAQKELIADLKRTQELRLDDVRRALRPDRLDDIRRVLEPKDSA